MSKTQTSVSGYITFTDLDDPPVTIEIRVREVAQFIMDTAGELAYNEKRAAELLLTATEIYDATLVLRADAHLKLAAMYRQRLTTLTTESGISESLIVAYIQQGRE